MTDVPSIVIGIAGRIGSGKTALAKRLSQDLGFQYLRYSQVLADWFQADPSDKVHLQNVGGDVMSGTEAQRELNRRLIQHIHGNQNVVVDGLRHPIDYESLRAEFGDRFFLIFIDTPEEVRFQRLLGRYATREEFQKADKRSVESHIDSLRPLARKVFHGAMSSESLMASIGELVRECQGEKVA